MPTVIEEIEKLGISNLDIVVLDASTDRTPQLVTELNKKYGNIVLQPRNDEEFGNAIKLGFNLALEKNYDRILTMDADQSHKPVYIPPLLDAVNNGGVAIGSRYIHGGEIEGWTLKRRAISRIANFLARAILGLKTRDTTTNFRCYTQEVVHKILPKLRCGGYACEVEIVYWASKLGFKIKEVPINFFERERGSSKLYKTEYLRFLSTIIKLRLRENLHFRNKTNQ